MKNTNYEDANEKSVSFNGYLMNEHDHQARVNRLTRVFRKAFQTEGYGKNRDRFLNKDQLSLIVEGCDELVRIYIISSPHYAQWDVSDFSDIYDDDEVYDLRDRMYNTVYLLMEKDEYYGVDLIARFISGNYSGFKIPDEEEEMMRPNQKRVSFSFEMPSKPDFGHKESVSDFGKWISTGKINPNIRYDQNLADIGFSKKPVSPLSPVHPDLDALSRAISASRYKSLRKKAIELARITQAGDDDGDSGVIGYSISKVSYGDIVKSKHAETLFEVVDELGYDSRLMMYKYRIKAL